MNSIIEAVENSLQTAISIEGRPHKSFHFKDRMAFYPVPGVSVAVINDQRIEWVQAYGVRDVETNAPVSTL